VDPDSAIICVGHLHNRGLVVCTLAVHGAHMHGGSFCGGCQPSSCMRKMTGGQGDGKG
jgi:hypothetical protein